MAADPEWLQKARAEGRITEGKPANLAAVTPQGKRIEGVKLSEAEFQQQVIDHAHAQGWFVAHFRKVRVQRENGETFWETPVAADGKGFPDLLLVRGQRMVVVELKVGKNTTTPEQDAWLGKLAAAGAWMRVWYPKDWPEIEKCLAPERRAA